MIPAPLPHYQHHNVTSHGILLPCLPHNQGLCPQAVDKINPSFLNASSIHFVTATRQLMIPPRLHLFSCLWSLQKATSLRITTIVKHWEWRGLGMSQFLSIIIWKRSQFLNNPIRGMFQAGRQAGRRWGDEQGRQPLCPASCWGNWGQQR